MPLGAAVFGIANDVLDLGAVPVVPVLDRGGSRWCGHLEVGHDERVVMCPQVLLELALVLIEGGKAISDFQTLQHLGPIIGAVPRTPTVWRGPGRDR